MNINNCSGPNPPNYMTQNLQSINQPNTPIANNYSPFHADVANKYQVTWDETIRRPVVHSRSRVIICEPTVNCCCNTNNPPNRYSVPNQNQLLNSINQYLSNQYPGHLGNIGPTQPQFGSHPHFEFPNHFNQSQQFNQPAHYSQPQQGNTPQQFVQPQHFSQLQNQQGGNIPNNAFSNINNVSCTQPGNYPNLQHMNMNVPQFGPACPLTPGYNNQQTSMGSNNFAG